MQKIQFFFQLVALHVALWLSIQIFVRPVSIFTMTRLLVPWYCEDDQWAKYLDLQLLPLVPYLSLFSQTLLRKTCLACMTWHWVLEFLQKFKESEVFLQPPDSRVSYLCRLSVKRTVEHGPMEGNARQTLVANCVTTDQQSGDLVALETKDFIANSTFQDCLKGR